MVAPDCPFDILSASSSGSARRLLVVTGLTGSVVNADALYVPDRKATTAAIRTSVLFIGGPIGMSGCRLRAGRSSLDSPILSRNEATFAAFVQVAFPMNLTGEIENFLLPVEPNQRF